MPTLEQLPAAVAVNPTDELLIDQNGNSVTATVSQVFDALPLGSGLTMSAGGTLSADTTVLAPLASPVFAGTPTAPTPPPGDNSNKLATTAFVRANTGGSGSATITLTGDVSGTGSGTIATTLPAITAPGTYDKVTVNAKGQVVSGGTLAPADISGALGYTPANPADVSAAEVTAAASSTARPLATRAADRINVLDYGADPSGTNDSAPAFLAAMNSVANGAWGGVWVPRGTYRLGVPVNQPAGRSIAVMFADGANITGAGYLGVDRIEASQGAFRTSQVGGGYFGFAPSFGSPTNLAFDGDYLFNTPQNSLSMRVGWDTRYTNTNLYGKYHSGIDIASQRIHSWPNLFDNSSGWGAWEVISSTTLDEDSMARAGLSTSAEHSEIDVVNNGPEGGWTWQSGRSTSVQGMSVDPWGQNGNYGGNLLFAYGTVGSYDGNIGGLNQRWIAYPAAFSASNPGAVAQNSTLTLTMDLTAHAAATLSGGGIGSVSVSSGGGAYASAPTVVFSGGGGSGAAGTPVMLGASVVGVTVTNPGSGYSSAPSVSFAGGGVASPVATTVTLNTDGAHGDLVSIASAINAAAIPSLRAAVTVWGGVVSRLVIFGTNPSDLGTLTLGGSALGTLGLNAGSVSALRGSYAMVMGGNGGATAGAQLSINGTVVTIQGATQAAAIAAINAAAISGVVADSNANGRLVLTGWMPQCPGGLVLANVGSGSTLGQLGLPAGTFWPPVPPKGFATAYSEVTSPVCLPTDQISIAATDLAGNSYGPVIATLNSGDGSGWPIAVAASIKAALQAGGFYSASFTALSTGTAVVAVKSTGSGANQGVYIRNTAGGTLTLADAHGAPLEALGLAAGTYQPGGYSAGSQSVFMAAEDAIAPGGRGVFIGGASNSTDVTTWPGTPLEARGNFQHGLRLDRATIGDATGITLSQGHAIAWGTKAQGQTTLAVNSGTLQANGVPLATAALVPAGAAGQVLTATGTQGVMGLATPSAVLDAAFGSTYGDMLYRGAAGWVALVPGATGQALLSGGPGANPVWGTALPAGSHGAYGEFVVTSGTLGLAYSLAIGSGFASNAGTLSLAPASTGQLGGIVVGSGLTANAGGTVALAATLSGETLNAAALVGTTTNTGTITGGTLSVAALAGTVTNTGTLSGGAFAGSVALSGTLVGGTLTPATISGGSLAGTITNAGTLSGGALAGTVTLTGTLSGGVHSGATLSGVTTNSGTISGGTLAGSVTASGTLNITGTGTATTQAISDNSTKLATTAFVAPAFAPLFGTGADGAVTINSGTTTLTRDMHYSNLTISGTGTLQPNGYTVYVRGTLDISAAAAGAIAWNGSSNGISAQAYTTPPAANGGFSTAGGTGVGAAGVSYNRYPGYGGDGGASGAGGAGTNVGGALGASPQITARVTAPSPFQSLLLSMASQASSQANGFCPNAPWASQGGASGGNGGGDGTNNGGGNTSGGGGGGAVLIRAAVIARGSNATASIIQAKGGSPTAGGSSAAGNTGGAGGSGGGGGGLIDITVGTLTGSTITNALDVSGGNGSAGGNGFGAGKGGAGGTGGNGGLVQIRNLSAQTFTTNTANTAGTAGGTTSTTTGASGGVGATAQVSL